LPIATPRQWRVIHVQVPPLAAESVASLLVETTGRGVTLTESDEQVTITGYIYQQPEAIEKDLAEQLRQLAANLGMAGAFQINVSEIAETDWLGEWRDSYRPLRVGRRLVIKPSWHTWPPADGSLPAFDDDIVIEMDPQMAFGTGQHPTTQSCLEVLEDTVRPGCTVADVGCGSGILSIAAIKLGAATAVAIDNDPIAVQIAQANAVDNSVAAQVKVILGEGLKATGEQFDIVLANINTPTIVALSGNLAQHTARGGCVVVAGIPVVRADRVTSTLRQAGLWVTETRVRGSWVCIVAQRSGNTH